MKAGYHAIGDDDTRRVRVARKQSKWMTGIHHQSLVVRHGRQVVHRQPELDRQKSMKCNAMDLAIGCINYGQKSMKYTAIDLLVALIKFKHVTIF